MAPGEPAGDAARDLEADVYRYIIERARYESIRATDAGMIAKAVGDRFRAAQRQQADAPYSYCELCGWSGPAAYASAPAPVAPAERLEAALRAALAPGATGATGGGA